MDKSTPRHLLVLTDALRLTDNPLLQLVSGEPFLAVALLDSKQFATGRASTRRLALQQRLLLEAQDRFARAGLPLLLLNGAPGEVLPALCQQYQLNSVVLPEPVGPDEYRDIRRLPAGISVKMPDINTLLADNLRPDLHNLPRSFTVFRKALEPALQVCPPLPAQSVDLQQLAVDAILSVPAAVAASSVPIIDTCIPPMPSADLSTLLPKEFGSVSAVAEPGAKQRFLQYLPHGWQHYKHSRNALTGADFASFLSVPLSRGTLSVRWVWHQICQYEQQHGVTDSSYWLKFELLWREYFRHLLRRHQHALFLHQGIGRHQVQPVAPVSHDALQRWQQGQTGEPLVDASMRLLKHSGWLSNRARQNVASYLHFELGCDWRDGAAWFEQQLLDYDVASNWGNWAYIAGALDSAPRRFNLSKQSAEYDPGLEQCQAILAALRASE